MLARFFLYRYKSRIEDDEQNVSSADGLEAPDGQEEEGGGGEGKSGEPAELWDLLRPLIGDCELRLLKFEDKEAQVSSQTVVCARQYIDRTHVALDVYRRCHECW